MPDDLTQDDILDLMENAGIGENPEEPAQGDLPPADEGEPEGEPMATPDPAIATMTAQMTTMQAEMQAQRDQHTQLMGVIGEFARQNKQAPAAPQAPAPAKDFEDLTSEEVDKLWPKVATVPGLGQRLVENQVKAAMAKLKLNTSQMVEDKLTTREMQDFLRTSAFGSLNDEIRDPKSEIMTQVPFMKKRIEGMIRPELVGTDAHDQLALIMAAGTNPSALAKRHAAQAEVREAQRSKARDRLSALAQSGGGRAPAATPMTLDGDARAIAEELGIDLEDKEVLARIEHNIGSERLERW